MMKFKSILAGLVLTVLACAPAFAQSVGQLGSGQMWANTGAGQGRGSPTSASAYFDFVYGNTRGAILERGASGWGKVNPSSTSGLPWVSNGTGADPAYQILGPSGGGTGVNNGANTLTLNGNTTITPGVAGQLAIWNAGTLSGSYAPTLGVAGSQLGQICFVNLTSGSACIQPAAGALGTAVATLPAGTYNLVGDSLTQTLTNKTFNCANNTCTVRLGSDVTGALPVLNGGTGQTTVPAARASSGLNIDEYTGHGDSNYTIQSTDRTVGTSAAFTASRTWTLPAANSVNPGQEIIVADFQGTVTGTNTLVVSRSGADTINGVTSVTITSANGAYLFRSDGVSKWSAQAIGPAAAGGVSSVTCGTGLSGGTITTSGTCAVSLTTASNVLGADVLLNNTASYFDGPSMAQGTSGTWFASGSVIVIDTTTAPAAITCKLWDGTTVISSGFSRIVTANTVTSSLTLSGYISSPVGNIRISCIDPSSTNGKILFNQSGLSKDANIWGIRVQ